MIRSVRLLASCIAPLAAALGLPTPPSPIQDVSLELDDGQPDQGNGNGPGEPQDMPDPGAFVVADGKGGQIIGVRFGAGVKPDSIEELREDGGGVNVTGTVEHYALASGTDGRAVTVQVRKNSGGGVEGMTFAYAPGV